MLTSTKPTVKRKSRTIARPAFQGKIFVGNVCLVFVLLLICQMTSIQIVSVFLNDAEARSQVWIPPAMAQEIYPQTKTRSLAGSPMRIEIPSIKVSAAIGPVGILKNGAMGAPEKASDTAWYKYGPKPGEKGSAVIAGHVDWHYGAKGVFARLNTLKTGDKISVQDDKGKTMVFVVRGSREYNPKEDATDVFRSHDGKSYLNLVTCSGVWNRLAKSYTKRLVIFTEMVTEQPQIKKTLFK
jgi:LPXTG-site transpeptidase (sortase) family protein